MGIRLFMHSGSERHSAGNCTLEVAQVTEMVKMGDVCVARGLEQERARKRPNSVSGTGFSPYWHAYLYGLLGRYPICLPKRRRHRGIRVDLGFKVVFRAESSW